MDAVLLAGLDEWEAKRAMSGGRSICGVGAARQAFGPGARIELYHMVRIALGLLLVAAAGLKAYQLATEPVIGNGIVNSRWFLITLVEFELIFGLWLLYGLYHIETERWDPFEECQIFDGAILTVMPVKAGSRRRSQDNGDPEVIVKSDARSIGDLRTLSDHPIFYAAGYPYLGRPFTPGMDSSLPLDPKIFSVQRKLYDGPECHRVVLRTMNSADKTLIYEYIVDLTRQSAVLTAALDRHGQREYQIDIVHQNTANDWWVPESWVMNVFHGASLLTSERTRVKKVTLNSSFDPTFFTAKLIPGSVVEKDGQIYQVGDAGLSLQTIAARTSDTMSRGRSFLFATIAVVATLAVVVAIVYKTCRTADARSSSHPATSGEPPSRC